MSELTSASEPAGETVTPTAGFGFESARSREFYERLSRSMPGANTRTATYFQPFPLTISRGEGAWITDLDGNRFIDLVNNYTSLVHGHSAPAVVEALRAQLDGGTVHPSPIELQAGLAERLVERVPSVEQVRFTNSGTEANMNAVRCARAATGRSQVLKADWGYHGSWDGLPPVKTDTTGICPSVLGEIHWVDYNDADAIERVMAEHGSDIAAIILEPLLGAGVIPGERDFLETARRTADEHGAVLIIDEVVSLRAAYGGIAAGMGIRPDLTTFGKVIGGGLPVGALGGSGELMSLYDPRREDPIPHHGTFNGNVLTAAAGIASLDLLSEAEIARINALGARLAGGLTDLSRKGGIPPFTVTQVGSLVQTHFETGDVIRSGSDLNPGSRDLAAFHRSALNHGVYIAPRGEMNLTTAMDEALVDEALDRLGSALDAIGD